MAEEKNPQLLYVTTLPLKVPIGLFPKSLQPYSELIRFDKVYFGNIQDIMQRSSFWI